MAPARGATTILRLERFWPSIVVAGLAPAMPLAPAMAVATAMPLAPAMPSVQKMHPRSKSMSDSHHDRLLAPAVLA